MANSRYKFFSNVWNDDIQHNQKGSLDYSIIDKIKAGESIPYIVQLGEEFRPDIIAHKFYNDSKLYWILVYVNDIKNSPEGFYTQREIRIPSPDAVKDLL